MTGPIAGEPGILVDVRVSQEATYIRVDSLLIVIIIEGTEKVSLTC